MERGRDIWREGGRDRWRDGGINGEREGWRDGGREEGRKGGPRIVSVLLITSQLVSQMEGNDVHIARLQIT